WGGRGRAHRAQMPRRELDTERKAVDASHDLRDRFGVLRIQREAGPPGRGPLDEQPHGRRFGDRGRVRTRCGDGERPDAPDELAGQPEYLATRREDLDV